jgi:ABC-type transport system involved in cytochrome bd biosynthesis fused ATPase/permease subunit
MKKNIKSEYLIKAWNILPKKVYFIVLSIITSFLQIAVSLFIGYFSESVLNDQADNSINSLYLIGTGVVLVASALSQSILLKNISINSWIGGIELVKRRTYTFFKRHDRRITEDYSKSAINDYQRLAQGVLTPLMMLISSVLMVIVLFSGVVYIIGVLQVLIGICILCLFVFYPTILLRRKISKNSIQITKFDSLRFQRVQGAIRLRKEAILYNIKNRIIDLVVGPSLDYGTAVGRGVFMSGLFKPLYETVGLIMLVAAVVTLKGQGFASVGELGALVFLLYRVIPALQQTFINLGRINNNYEVLDNFRLYDDKKNLEETNHLDVNKINTFDICLEDSGSMFCIPDLSFKKGKINVIMGDSGIGKSTALDCILNVINYKGQVKFYESNGNKIDNVGNYLCGYAPQFPELFAGLSLRDSILTDDININVAKKLQVADILERNVIVDGEKSELSGGQKKRIGLLRCLSIERPVLLLDEPTSGLDIENSKAVWEILSLRATTSLVIVTSHELPSVNKDKYIIKNFNNVNKK